MYETEVKDFCKFSREVKCTGEKGNITEVVFRNVFWLVIHIGHFHKINETMGVKFYHVVTRYILSVNGWFFEGITMRYNQVDLLYQHALTYYHRAENYQQSILQDITPFGLRLK